MSTQILGLAWQPARVRRRALIGLVRPWLTAAARVGALSHTLPPAKSMFPTFVRFRDLLYR